MCLDVKSLSKKSLLVSFLSYDFCSLGGAVGLGVSESNLTSLKVESLWSNLTSAYNSLETLIIGKLSFN